jgi:hypothetical protein
LNDHVVRHSVLDRQAFFALLAQLEECRLGGTLMIEETAGHFLPHPEAQSAQYCFVSATPETSAELRPIKGLRLNIARTSYKSDAASR